MDTNLTGAIYFALMLCKEHCGRSWDYAGVSAKPQGRESASKPDMSMSQPGSEKGG